MKAVPVRCVYYFRQSPENLWEEAGLVPFYKWGNQGMKRSNNLHCNLGVDREKPAAFRNSALPQRPRGSLAPPVWPCLGEAHAGHCPGLRALGEAKYQPSAGGSEERATPDQKPWASGSCLRPTRPQQPSCLSGLRGNSFPKSSRRPSLATPEVRGMAVASNLSKPDDSLGRWVDSSCKVRSGGTLPLV